jgi:hypothetical protein
VRIRSGGGWRGIVKGEGYVLGGRGGIKSREGERAGWRFRVFF